MSDPTGFASAPAHYAGLDREVIDLIRDSMTDVQFAAYCQGNAIKYAERAPLKGQPEQDMKKCRWYVQMREHVLLGTADPRAYRDDGFVAYVRQSPKQYPNIGAKS